MVFFKGWNKALNSKDAGKNKKRGPELKCAVLKLPIPWSTQKGTFVDQGRKASQHLRNVGMMYVVMSQIVYAIRYFYFLESCLRIYYEISRYVIWWDMWYVKCASTDSNLFWGCESASDYYSDYYDYSLALTLAEWAGWLCFLSLPIGDYEYEDESVSNDRRRGARRDSKKSPVFCLHDTQIWNVRKLGCKIQLHAICLCKMCISYRLEMADWRRAVAYFPQFPPAGRRGGGRKGHRRRSRSRHMDHGGWSHVSGETPGVQDSSNLNQLDYNTNNTYDVYDKCGYVMNSCSIMINVHTLCVILIIVDIYMSIYALM